MIVDKLTRDKLTRRFALIVDELTMDKEIAQY